MEARSAEQLEELLAVEIAAIRYMVKWGVYKDIMEAVECGAEPLSMVLSGAIRGKAHSTLQELLDPLKTKLTQTHDEHK